MWIKGFPGLPCYLPHRQQRQVSAHLRLLKLPTDYQRKLRDLRYVQLCKAHEYRMFLLVSGFVVGHWPTHFCIANGDLYSPVLINSNVHNLLHVYEDVR
uniref:Uncharacterized protein n=1 Tax=Anopheles quadriannulatus TaxID=34691 RepID=A0A182XPX6_ANOQN